MHGRSLLSSQPLFSLSSLPPFVIRPWICPNPGRTLAEEAREKGYKHFLLPHHGAVSANCESLDLHPRLREALDSGMQVVFSCHLDAVNKWQPENKPAGAVDLGRGASWFHDGRPAGKPKSGLTYHAIDAFERQRGSKVMHCTFKRDAPFVSSSELSDLH